MGLGDIVYYFTHYTGLRWLTKKISKKVNKDCGCDKRREEWNDITIDLSEKWKNWID